MKTHLKRTILLLCLTLQGVFSIQAQAIRATAAIDSVDAKIGQQVHLTLELSQPKDAVVNFPLITDTIIDKVEVLHKSSIDTTFENAKLLLTQKLTITNFDSGFYFVPGFVFDIDTISGGGSITSNPVVLKIATFEADTTKGFFDIRSQQDVPYTLREMVPWLIGGIVFFALVLLTIYIIRRIKNKEPLFAVKEKPKELPHIIAIRELDRIKESKIWQSDQVKEFHTEVTDVLRDYIEERFDIAALEMTSDEIIDALKHSNIDNKSTMQNLTQILKLADMVKFAKMKPLIDENDLSLMNAYFFINQTKQEEVKSLEETREEIENKKEETTNKD